MKYEKYGQIASIEDTWLSEEIENFDLDILYKTIINNKEASVDTMVKLESELLLSAYRQVNQSKILGEIDGLTILFSDIPVSVIERKIYENISKDFFGYFHKKFLNRLGGDDAWADKFFTVFEPLELKYKLEKDLEEKTTTRKVKI